MVSPEQMGLYSAGFQIGMIISLFQNSFNQAWTPWFFEKLNEDCAEAKREIVKITYLYIVAILALVAAFNFITPFIMSAFVGERYAEAIHFVPWVALGFAATGMYKMFIGYLFYLKKTVHIAVLTIITAVVNIILNYVLIGHFGTIGAAYATCISFFVQAGLAWFLSQRLYAMPWGLPRAEG
jgi:O-antigen/teichoic acid export membrane protein